MAEMLKDYRVVVEVGAGNGRLSHFLRERLPECNIIATDNGSWEIEPLYPVEQIDVAEALEKYKPEIVISCWMPYTHDWTPMFRASDGLIGYILIGETDGGCCGSDKTWGFCEEKPEYEEDGFERIDLIELSRLQICRTDYFLRDYEMLHSSTVFFKKISFFDI